MMFVSSNLVVESIIALLSCAILLVLLGTPPIKRPNKRRAFRISSIPPHVTEGELRTCLKSLLKDCTPDDLIISLVPYSYGKEQMATVTFTRKEPSPFSEYKLERVHVQNEGMGFDFTVDCEFQGVTPLYSAKDPTVECVEVSLVRSFDRELTAECAVLLLSPGLLDTHSGRGNRVPRTIKCG